jgi:BCCT family betaine/carnitine transporter
LLSALILAGASIPLFVFPDVSEAVLENVYGVIAGEFGVFYLLASVSAIGFLVWLGFSHYGSLRLGDPDETPEFRELSWVGMLFCAGVGAGLLYWCVTEWAFYYDTPPFGAEPRSVEAQEWASTYGMFHWGFTAWAFYCLPTIAIAYPYYTKKLDILRFSVSCHWFLKDNDHGPVARTIDFLFMIAMLGGAASGLGFSTPMIAACLAWLFGIESNDALEIAVVTLCMFLFALSVWLGLKKGIKRLSDINVTLAFGLLVFVLFAGPTVFLLKTSLNSLGLMADNFLRMNFWTDPFTESGFVENWTVFYWAWWIAFAPYVGLFVTRISRGRTIRQVIFGMMVWGSLGGWLFYMIFGNYAMFLEVCLGHRNLFAHFDYFCGDDLRLRVIHARVERDPAPQSRRRPGALASRVLGLRSRDHARRPDVVAGKPAPYSGDPAGRFLADTGGWDRYVDCLGQDVAG